MLDTRRLQTLHAVVEAGSITGAAGRLSVTPSAVSQQIGALERETRTVLIEPAGRGIRPTAAGRLLADHAARLLQGLAGAEAALVALRAGETGLLRMASFATAGAELIPPALARVHRKLPDLEITLRVADRVEALQLLDDGLLDIAVIETHEALLSPDSGIEFLPLLTDPFRIVFPRGHRLATKRTLSLAEAAEEPWIDLRCEVGCCREATDSAFRRAGFDPRRVVEADEYWPAQGFVAAGLGFALIPELALGVRHPGIAVRRLKRADQPERRIVAAVRRSVRDCTPVAAMLQALSRQADDRAAAPQR